MFGFYFTVTLLFWQFDHDSQTIGSVGFKVHESLFLFQYPICDRVFPWNFIYWRMGKINHVWFFIYFWYFSFTLLHSILLFHYIQEKEITKVCCKGVSLNIQIMYKTIHINWFLLFFLCFRFSIVRPLSIRCTQHHPNHLYLIQHHQIQHYYPINQCLQSIIIRHL